VWTEVDPAGRDEFGVVPDSAVSYVDDCKLSTARTTPPRHDRVMTSEIHASVRHRPTNVCAEPTANRIARETDPWRRYLFNRSVKLREFPSFD